MAAPKRHHFMLMIFFALSLVIFFPNTIFYTISLLILVLYLTMFMVSLSFLSSLVSLILVLVYVGAIMILVGYICAVSPNVITSLKVSPLPLLLTISIFRLGSDTIFSSVFSQSSPSSYFYSDGVIVFLSIVFMLFVTLLIVTSQYSSPRGPFRSL